MNLFEQKKNNGVMICTSIKILLTKKWKCLHQPKIMDNEMSKTF